MSDDNRMEWWTNVILRDYAAPLPTLRKMTAAVSAEVTDPRSEHSHEWLRIPEGNGEFCPYCCWHRENAVRAQLSTATALLRKIHGDLLARAAKHSDGTTAVDLSKSVWDQLRAFLSEGKQP